LAGSAVFWRLASSLLLLLTAGGLALLLRRGLAPLERAERGGGGNDPEPSAIPRAEERSLYCGAGVLAGALESATRRLEEAFVQQQVFVNDAATN